MIGLLLHLVRLCPFLFGGHRQLALENLALRQQLAVYKRTATRPKLRNGDRLFWAWLSRVWTSWRTALVIVTPDTVLRWQRRRFRDYWTTLSGRPTVGRPPVHAEIKALVAQMAAANPLWGAPRIHGELLKLGIAVSERTVSRLMPKRSGPPSQTFSIDDVRDAILRASGAAGPSTGIIAAPCTTRYGDQFLYGMNFVCGQKPKLRHSRPPLVSALVSKMRTSSFSE